NLVRFSVSLPEKTTFYADVESHNLSLSPDGRRLAFIAINQGQRRLYLRTLDQIEAQPVKDTDGAYSPFWSPDSRTIAFFADGKLKKVEAGTGAVQTICNAAESDTAGSWGRD